MFIKYHIKLCHTILLLLYVQNMYHSQILMFMIYHNIPYRPTAILYYKSIPFYRKSKILMFMMHHTIPYRTVVILYYKSIPYYKKYTILYHNHTTATLYHKYIPPYYTKIQSGGWSGVLLQSSSEANLVTRSLPWVI